MVSKALSTSDEVVVMAGAAPMLPTELQGNTGVPETIVHDFLKENENPPKK